MAELDIEKPAISVTLSSGRKVKMTYGLEMDIRRMLPDPVTAVQLALNDPHTQDYIVRRALTDVRKMITDPEKELIEEVPDDIDLDDTERLVVWAVEHVLYFFTKRVASMNLLGQRYQVALRDPSSSGSNDSPSTTPSAGPSE